MLNLSAGPATQASWLDLKNIMQWNPWDCRGTIIFKHIVKHLFMDVEQSGIEAINQLERTCYWWSLENRLDSFYNPQMRCTRQFYQGVYDYYLNVGLPQNTKIS